ncbi:MAG TPA: hypothetical protein VKZ44_07140 [Taishania sp.]|nr:hypothetical protein [Taishania sp.]
MYKIRYIFFLATFLLLSFSYSNSNEVEFVEDPYEEVVDDTEASFYELWEELEDEVIFRNNWRRSKPSQDNSCDYNQLIQFAPFKSEQIIRSEQEFVYKLKSYLTASAEETFLHRFQLF